MVESTSEQIAFIGKVLGDMRKAETLGRAADGWTGDAWGEELTPIR